jgi:hypothetical protein
MDDEACGICAFWAERHFADLKSQGWTDDHLPDHYCPDAPPIAMLGDNVDVSIIPVVKRD